MKHKYYIGLGSNLNDRTVYLAQARAGLEIYGQITNSSQVIETAPFGSADQPFLNQVLEYHSEFEPTELLDVVKDLETTIGRQPRERWGNREIDIDIILWDGEKLDTVTPQGHTLVLPHPGLPDRAFLLRSLQELGVEHPLD